MPILTVFPDADLAGPWELNQPVTVDGSGGYRQPRIVASDVAGYLAERRLEQQVSREQRIGALRTVTVAAPHDDDARAAAARHGIEIDAVSLQSAVAAHGLVPVPADQLQNA